MAHKCGLPYVVPRAHTIHSQSPSGLANRSVDNLPHTSTIDALHGNSHLKDSMVSAQQEQRMVKSEHGSPLLSPMSNLDVLNGQLPPLDLSSLPNDYTFMQQLDGFSAFPDQEQPMFSAGLSSASIDWSHYDGLNFNNDNFAPSNYSQAPSFNGFDFSSLDQPALTTTSTSGEISEVEDLIPLGEHGSRPHVLNHQYGSDYNSDFGGDVDGYRLSTASSYIGIPQAQMLADNNIEGLDLDAFLKAAQTAGAHAGNHGLPASSWDEGKMGATSSPYTESSFQQFGTEEDNDIFWMHTFAPHVVANHGHSDLHEDSLWAQ
jgi:hypothetical protein